MKFKAGDQILMILQANREKQFLVRLEPGREFHTHKGFIRHDDIIGQEPASRLVSSLGTEFCAVYPRLDDLIMKTKRQTQIMYPKDIGLILLRGNIRPGAAVLEAGTGSGTLTGIMAMMVGPSGRIKTFERRPEFIDNSKNNISRFGDYLEAGVVEIISRDVYVDGFAPYTGQTVILDLPEPWQCLPRFPGSLEPGGSMVCLLPTMGQVGRLLDAMQGNFTDMMVEELLLREWKTDSFTLRPVDRMIGHTGFLISGRFMPGMAPLAASPTAGADPVVPGAGPAVPEPEVNV